MSRDEWEELILGILIAISGLILAGLCVFLGYMAWIAFTASKMF